MSPITNTIQSLPMLLNRFFTPPKPHSIIKFRQMIHTTLHKASSSHIERTANEPRDDSLHTLKILSIKQINPLIRTFRLQPLPPPEGTPKLTFKPGQWLDVYCPGIPKPGGFTITSSPSKLSPPPSQTSTTTTTNTSHPTQTQTPASASSTQIQPPKPYIELAIQHSPLNPPAAYLWSPASKILNTTLQVRVGGTFTYPPSLPLSSPSIKKPAMKKVIFIAGGVGINPLISMLSFLSEEKQKSEMEGKGKGELGFKIQFLYSYKSISSLQNKENDNDEKEGERGERSEGEILFLNRLRRQISILGPDASLHCFVTGSSPSSSTPPTPPPSSEFHVKTRRINQSDLENSLGPISERNGTVVFLCGRKEMTDEFIALLNKAEGIEGGENIFFERWW